MPLQSEMSINSNVLAGKQAKQEQGSLEWQGGLRVNKCLGKEQIELILHI